MYMYANGISEKDYQTWQHKTPGTKPGTKRGKLHKSNPESLRQKGVICAWAHAYKNNRRELVLNWIFILQCKCKFGEEP